MEENFSIEPRADIEARISAGESAIYIVVRCADQPASLYPPGVRARMEVIGCTGCQEPCWIDPAAFIPGTTIRCLQCLRSTQEGR